MSGQAVGEHQLEDGFWIGDWFVDPRSNLLSNADKTCRVEPKVMHVLLCMAEQPMRTVTKEAFMQEVWNGTVVTDDALSRCISELRKVLGGSPRNPQYIETIRKSGYRLIAPVAFASDEAGGNGAAPALPSPTGPAGNWAPARAAKPHRPADNRILVLGAGLLLVALVGFLWLSGTFERDTQIPLRTVPFTSLPGEELQPAPSPDGEQVAFAWDGGEGENYDIYVKQVGTETPLRLTESAADERSPAWSPDGRDVAFVRCADDGCGVFITQSLGGAEREVIAPSPREIESLVWSPEGDALAYSARSEPGAAFGLYLLSVETREEHRVTSPPDSYFGDFDPAFSPDGGRLAFTRSEIEGVQDVYVVPTEGGEEALRQLTSDGAEVTGLDWSADGREVIFASNRGGASSLWRVPLAGGTPAFITTAGDGVSMHQPSVSRVGERLTYEQRATETNIWQLQRPNGSRPQPQRLISSTRWDSHPAFSPDGDRIAFASQRSGSQEIWVSERDGSNPVRLTFFDGPFASAPRWSPDGTQIAFDARGEGHADVYAMGTGGDRPRRLSAAASDDVAPSWSADGAWLYFASNRSGSWEIWRKPAEGGRATRVTRRGGVRASESPDGQWLYYAKSDTSGIWRTPTAVIPVDTSAAPAADGEAAEAGSLTTTPGSLAAAAVDVDTAALAAREAAADAAYEEELVFAHLDPTDAGNWVVLEDGLYFVRRREQGPRIEYLRFADGLIYPIASLKDLPEHPSLAVSPDGEWFLVTQVDRSESDILMVEDFR